MGNDSTAMTGSMLQEKAEVLSWLRCQQLFSCYLNDQCNVARHDIDIHAEQHLPQRIRQNQAESDI